MMNRTAALRTERAEVIAFCRDLDDSEWSTPSAAQGWRVQDVVAHLGSGCHALFTPASLALLRSSDIERANDTLVDARRSWTPSRVLGEFERWSGRVAKLSSLAEALPLSRVRIPLAELGKFPVPVLIGGAMVFDQHTHLRYDIAPAVGRAAPSTDANRMAVVIEWMLSVLGNQLALSAPPWMDPSVSLTLTGPGGGDWLISGSGVASVQGEANAVATVTSPASRFPEWATRRADWRDREVSIAGDKAYAEQFLDSVNVV